MTKQIVKEDDPYQFLDGTYTPGSAKAIDNNCACPVLDNAHGIGYMGVSGKWVWSPYCEYHFRQNS